MNKSDALKRLAELKDKHEKMLKEKELASKKILIHETQNKLLYFNKPGYGHLGSHGKWEFNSVQKQLKNAWLDPFIKIITMTGANRISKTFSSFSIPILSSIRGMFPWEDESLMGHHWDILGWEPPIKVRWIGQDWEKHIKATLEPKIEELLPRSWGWEYKKNNVGAKYFWKDPKTGGSLEILSNNSESDVLEGWNGHLVVYDEPPKRDNRVACARGLVDFCGREVFAMTLLKEAWVDSEVINATLEDGTIDSTVYNIHADISVNVGFGITQAGVDQFAKTLKPHEKEARLRGVPSYKAGLILKINRNVHFINRFEIPAHWIIDIAIDIGPSKGHDILYLATAPLGFKYACFAEFVEKTDNIADSIIKKIGRYQMRVNKIICDDLAKGDKAQANTVWDKIDTELNRFGYFLSRASKNKDDGIIMINDLLNPVTAQPSLFFFNDLPIANKQFINWMYDENGKPSKKEDDYCENLYRLILLDTQYEEPLDEDDEPKRKAQANFITGY